MPVAATPAAVLKARYRYNGEPKKMKGAMSDPSGLPRSHERWARFRFSVIGPLLAAPPERGELQEQLKNLAAKKWQHPITGQRVQFGLSTIERWYPNWSYQLHVDNLAVLIEKEPTLGAAAPSYASVMRPGWRRNRPGSKSTSVRLSRPSKGR